MLDYGVGSLTVAGPIVAYPSWPFAATKPILPANIKSTVYVRGAATGVGYIGIAKDLFIRDEAGRIINDEGTIPLLEN